MSFRSPLPVVALTDHLAFLSCLGASPPRQCCWRLWRLQLSQGILSRLEQGIWTLFLFDVALVLHCCASSCPTPLQPNSPFQLHKYSRAISVQTRTDVYCNQYPCSQYHCDVGPSWLLHCASLDGFLGHSKSHHQTNISTSACGVTGLDVNHGCVGVAACCHDVVQPLEVLYLVT